MRKTVEFAAVFALASSVTLAGCTEQMPTAISDGPATSFFESEPAPGYEVVRRNAPLADDLSVTRVIGPEGGTLDLPRAGVSLEVPEGALAKPTAITLTAVQGDALAFELLPRDLPLGSAGSLRIQARGTSVAPMVLGAPEGELTGVLGVRYEGDPETGVTPVQTSPTKARAGTMVVPVLLLSGYATASG